MLAADAGHIRMCKQSGRRIVDMVWDDLTPDKILTPKAIENSIAVHMAMGGSTNTVLHLLAAAREAELPYDLHRVAEVSARTPYLCKVSPSVPDVHMEDIEAAGGVPAILKELDAIGKLHSTAEAHERVMVVELMGRNAGWIALHAGVASGSDVIVLPEIEYDLEKVCDFVRDRSQRGKRFSLICISHNHFNLE